MSFLWLILALLTITGDGYSMFKMSQTHAPALEYVMGAGSMILGLAMLYGAVVEGYPLAYAIIAWGIVSAIRGIYSLATKSWISGGVNLAVGLLFIMWGMQRYSAAGMIPMMAGGRRRSHKYW